MPPNRRRPKGEGSLFQRKDGLWVAQFGGVSRYARDKATARTKLIELLAQADSSKPDKITVSKYMDQWLEFAGPNLKPSTRKRYSEVIKLYVKPYL